MKVAILLTKILLCQSDKQSEVIIIKAQLYFRNNNVQLNILKAHMHLFCE
jgi:hypothetical protein